jgi:hypothetical protein
MKAETKLALKIAGLGFGVGIALGFNAFLPSTYRFNEGFYLLLCPPSFASMALENASTEVAIQVWLVIAILNAFVYLLVAAIFRAIFGSFTSKISG